MEFCIAGYPVFQQCSAAARCSCELRSALIFSLHAHPPVPASGSTPLRAAAAPARQPAVGSFPAAASSAGSVHIPHTPFDAPHLHPAAAGNAPERRAGSAVPPAAQRLSGRAAAGQLPRQLPGRSCRCLLWRPWAGAISCYTCPAVLLSAPWQPCYAAAATAAAALLQ